jgi:hypothetical protein
MSISPWVKESDENTARNQIAHTKDTSRLSSAEVGQPPRNKKAWTSGIHSLDEFISF